MPALRHGIYEESTVNSTQGVVGNKRLIKYFFPSQRTRVVSGGILISHLVYAAHSFNSSSLLSSVGLYYEYNALALKKVRINISPKCRKVTNCQKLLQFSSILSFARWVCTMYYFAASTGWVFDIHTSLQVHNRPSYLILCTYTTLINNAHRRRQ